MAKLGDFEFPEIGLVESIELGQKIAREFAGEVSRQGLARSLGMSERGGAFSARLGALRLWGVAGGRSRVRVTRDGLRAVTPLSAKESEEARAALSRNVALFVEVSIRIGEGPYTPDRLAVLLEELSGADRTEVARRLPLIDRIFSEARPFLPKPEPVTAPQYESPRSILQDQLAGVQSNFGQTGPGTPPGSIEETEILFGSASVSDAEAGEEDHPTETSKSGTGGDRIELGLPDGTLSLPETLANLDAALTVLWARRQLVAAVDAAEGRPAPAPPHDYSR
jgi:hypothetical protein